MQLARPRRRSLRAGSGIALLLALLLASPAARAQVSARSPRPHSGIGGIVVGWAGLGWGVLNLGTLPICFADFYPREARAVCTATSITLGAGGLVAAAIGLSVGYPRRAEYKRWRELQTVSARDSFALTPLPTGVLLSFARRFPDPH